MIVRVKVNTPGMKTEKILQTVILLAVLGLAVAC